MTTTEWEVPSAGELRDQLLRILRSNYFNKAYTQAKLLRFVVEMHIAGTSIMEADIGDKIFENYNANSHTVRSNATLVRDKLEKFYRFEGQDDLVKIELIAGANYKLAVSYHGKATLIRRYKQGLHLMRDGLPASLESASVLFWTIRDQSESFLPVYVSHAECRLLLAIVNTLFDFLESRNMRFDANGALDYLLEVAGRTEGSVPRLHLISAAAHLLTSNKAHADSEIQLALAEDFHETTSSLWYAAYLVLSRKEYKRALEVITAKKAAEPENFGVRVLGAALLYSDCQYAAAANWIADVYVREGGELFEPMILGLAHMAQGNYDFALLAFNLASEMSHREKAWLDRYCPFNEKPDRFPGFIIQALVGSGRIAEAEIRLAALQRQKSAKPFDLMIGYMALGRMGRSLAWYARASFESHFLMEWLEFMPCFNTLTKHPRFVEVKGYITASIADI